MQYNSIDQAVCITHIIDKRELLSMLDLVSTYVGAWLYQGELGSV